MGDGPGVAHMLNPQRPHFSAEVGAGGPHTGGETIEKRGPGGWQGTRLPGPGDQAPARGTPFPLLHMDESLQGGMVQRRSCVS